MRHFLLFSVMLFCCATAGAQKVRKFVEHHLETYPQTRLLDIYKSCFQDYMGAEHLVTDSGRVRSYLDEELRTTRSEDLMSWYMEPCGTEGRFVRVSIKAGKEGLITEDLLLSSFIRSANAVKRPSVKSWKRRWHKIMGKIDQIQLHLPLYNEDREFIDSLLSVGKYAISHSPDYRKAYRPHYRIVERRIYERELKPLLKRTSFVIRDEDV